MDLLYGVHQRPTLSRKTTQLKNKTVCKISNRNIVAFTTTSEIGLSNNISYGFFVYVADINVPWFTFKVTSHNHAITVLEWDICGKYLLIGDVAGNIEIWISNMISDWVHVYSVQIKDEPILQVVFFHNGKKNVLATDKKEQIQYLEKIQRIKFNPSVRQFGGVPAEGCLVLTSTGLICTFLVPSELPILQSQQSYVTSHGLNQNPALMQGPFLLPVVTESLSHTRKFITASDICYGKNGYFLIAAVHENGKIKSSLVKCFQVIVKRTGSKLTLASQSLPSFFLNEGSLRDVTDMKVTHLKWGCSEDGDSLIVGTTCSTGSILESWALIEKSMPIHQTFSSNKSDDFQTATWSPQANYRCSKKIIHITTSKFMYGNSSYIFLSMADNSLHCLYKDSFMRLSMASLSSSWRNENDHSPKQRKVEAQLAAHDITHMGFLLIAVDVNGQLFAVKLFYPFQEQTSQHLATIQTESLLEYCLLTGYDPLDLFFNIKMHLLDAIVDRMKEIFTKQPSSIQQYYYVNFLTMKTNIYRLSMNGQQKAHDLNSLLTLHSILIAFKSLLRPSDLITHDKGPVENLAMVLSDSATDVDKVLINLEAKDFTVEPSTLQSLQQLIQWVADLALNLLSRLPDNRPSSGHSKYEISKDIVALNSIRELLVIIRIWGLLKPQCLPVFARSTENLDVLSTLFRLLTRLALSPNEPDDLLLDECCLLPSQVLIPQLQYISSQTLMATPILCYTTGPLNLEYNVEPAILTFCPDIPVVEGGLSSDNMVDSVRHLQLGKRPSSLRRCTRCGTCSNVYSIARTAAMRAWEQRWANGCKCGGLWRLQTL